MSIGDKVDDALMVDGHIVTREQYRVIVAERDQYLALIQMLKSWAVRVVQVVSPGEKDQPLVCHIADLVTQGKYTLQRDELEAYDAGHLNDFGGGNISWWHDYIRSELAKAHDHYQQQIDGGV